MGNTKNEYAELLEFAENENKLNFDSPCVYTTVKDLEFVWDLLSFESLMQNKSLSDYDDNALKALGINASYKTLNRLYDLINYERLEFIYVVTGINEIHNLREFHSGYGIYDLTKF